jgi:hypothetical protein
LTILLTPQAKSSIEQRAKALGMTSSELARRALEAYDPARDEETLQRLADELAAVVDQTEARVDAALDALAAMRRELAAMDQRPSAQDRR